MLTTIHTSNACNADDELDISVEPYLIAGAVAGINIPTPCAQNLPNCQKAYTPTAEELESPGLGADEAHVFIAARAPNCFHTGYRGRTGVFETMIAGQSAPPPP